MFYAIQNTEEDQLFKIVYLSANLNAGGLINFYECSKSEH